jgi:hypothetical protein
LSCSRDVILLRRSSISFRMVSGFPPFAIVLACCCLFSKIRFFAVLKNPLSVLGSKTTRLSQSIKPPCSRCSRFQQPCEHRQGILLRYLCILDTFHASLGYLIFDVFPKKSLSPSWPLSR